MTPFLEQKLEHKFHLLDVNGNGVLEAADFERVVEVLAEERNWSEGHPRYAQLAKTNQELWQVLFDFCGGEEDGTVTMDDWFDFHANAIYYERRIGHEMPGMERTLERMSEFFHELLDSNGDGVVTEADYVEFLAAHGLEEEVAAASFIHMDRNADGLLSKQEVLLLIREFYFSEETQAPGNWFFGCLGH